jgi:hypothetical protein
MVDASNGETCPACGRSIRDWGGMAFDGDTYCGPCVMGGTPAHWSGEFDEGGAE